MPKGVYPRSKTSYDHVCRFCKITFTSESSTRLYCGMTCKNRAQAKPKMSISCLHCGNSFSPDFPSRKRKYCSTECVRLERLSRSKASALVSRAKAKKTQLPLSPVEQRRIKQEMLVQQNFYCKICTATVDMKSAFDHNHQTGEPRGVLCNRCNLGIGMFKDDPVLLRSAANYVEDACVFS